MKRNDFIRKMQQRLLIRRDAVRQTLAGEVNSLRRSRDASFGDEVDMSISNEQDEIGSHMAEVESRELLQVERALETMRLGNYGKCDSCDGPIGLPRLQAVPNATQCIACARRDERRSGYESSSTNARGYLPVEEPADELLFDDSPLDIG